MPKVEIDTNILEQLAKSLLSTAQVLSNITTSTVPKTESPKVAKKRGRPAKIKQLAQNNDEIIEVEPEILAIVNDNSPLPSPRAKEIYSPKQFAKAGGIGVASSSQVVTENRGEMRFMDIANVGDRISADKYPEPSERRPAKEKMQFTCDKCTRPFMAYPSEVPQAFVKEKISGVAEGRPLVKCDNCIAL